MHSQRLRRMWLLLVIICQVFAESWWERLETASKEAWTYGPSEYEHWSVQPGKEEFKGSFNFTLVFSEADAKGTNISCFRIPSVARTQNGTLLAFAEARGRFNPPFYNGSCADCSPLGIAVKRSFDHGASWLPFEWAVPPTFAAGDGKLRWSGGNPVAVYDHVHDRVLLHFVRGSRPGSNDCLPGHSNWQVTSADHGMSWSPPIDISLSLGPYAGSLPGPGNGAVQLQGDLKGRIVFNAHFGTAERGSGAVVVYYTDDGGLTFKRASTPPFAHMDESAIAEVVKPDGTFELLISMRNDPTTSGCIGSDCNVRAHARSADGGVTWGSVTFAKTLNDSVCEASLASIGNTTVFFNPNMQHMRSMPTLRFSLDGGHTWRSKLVADSFADYSALVGPLDSPTVGGVLWTGCTYPVPFRLWCTPVEALDDTFWTIGFTRFSTID